MFGESGVGVYRMWTISGRWGRRESVGSGLASGSFLSAKGRTGPLLGGAYGSRSANRAPWAHNFLKTSHNLPNDYLTRERMLPLAGGVRSTRLSLCRTHVTRTHKAVVGSHSHPHRRFRVHRISPARYARVTCGPSRQVSLGVRRFTTPTSHDPNPFPPQQRGSGFF